MFKRTRSKQPAEAKASTEPEPPQAAAKAPEPVPPKRKRKSFSSPLASDLKTVQQPRRSKRLSGDKAPDPSTPAQLKIKRRETVAPKLVPAPTKESSESPQLVGEELQVEKRNGTKIALPFADTPVQNRNKQMREKAAGRQKNRRSSSGIRGRRASSLLDSGTSNGKSTQHSRQSRHSLGGPHTANSSNKRIPLTRSRSEESTGGVGGHISFDGCEEETDVEEEEEANTLDFAALPHADVESRDFYKHIDQSLPEPHRMRHLLTWCGARALPDKVLGTTRDPSETLAVDAGMYLPSGQGLRRGINENIARHIQEELLKDFNGRHEMSEWFNREDAPTTVLVKKQNPRNVQNAAKLQELEQEIARLQGEKATWEKILSSASSPTAQTAPPEAAQDASSIDAALLDPSQASILEALRASESLPSTIAHRLQNITADLEPQIDAFADGVHRIAQYRLAAERVADRILSTAAERLAMREQRVREAAGTTSMGPKEVLSALASVLNRQER